MKILVRDSFKRDFKKLAKKYDNITDDLENLFESLKENPTQGTPLGLDCFKVRMSISDNNKGKGGGARVITCIKIIKDTIYLLTIYDKSEKESISKRELKDLVEQIEA